MSSRRRVVVTGAGGFIGTHLVESLRAAGIPVLAVVRRAPSVASGESGITIVTRDLERETLGDVLRPDDMIVHLAARAHVMRDTGEGAESAYHRANVESTRLLCHTAASAGARRILLLSSAKVFGEGRETPYGRTDPVAPADAYARSKVAAEEVLREAASGSAFEWTIMRPPFVYGPGGKGNFPRLLALARLSSVVPLPLASIHNHRSVLFVGNLVDAIVSCGLHDDAAGRVLLPTDARDVSTPDLLRAIAAARSSRARLFPFPTTLLRAAAAAIGRSGEMDRLTESLRLDSRHLHDELGWTPPFSLECALTLSVDSARRPSESDAHA
jgi:UDP-glucose 4-epimerase